MIRRKSRGKRLRVKREHRLNRRACALALAFIAIIVLVYFFWPRFEYASIKGGVAIVDSFYSSTPHFTDEAVMFLESKGLDVNVYRDSDVTVEFYMKLPTHGHSLIILRVHAGILGRDPTSPTFLFTNEPYTTDKYLIEQLTEQVLSGVVDPDNPEQKPVFTVGPPFVAMSMESKFNNSIIVLSSCLGLYTPQLADAFVKKGASAFIGWDEKVGLAHTDEASTLLLKALIEERMTIGEAVEKAMADVGSDPAYGSTLKYYPKEAGSLKLKP